MSWACFWLGHRWNTYLASGRTICLRCKRER